MRSLFYTFLCFLFYSANAQQTVGLFDRDTASEDGYVLFSPMLSDNTYLIDKCGNEVHSWTGTYKPGASVYFLPDGSLVRAGSVGNTTFGAGGSGGIIEKFDWDGNLIWSYTLSDTIACQHHDIYPMPNGNILAIMWEKKTVAEAISAGRNPSLLGTSLWSEKVVELQPVGSNDAHVVWEWHVWDHLVQDFDNARANFGSVVGHPELIDINFINPGGGTTADWLHINAIAYNPKLNQIMLSIHHFSEIWIIDHSTTTSEAAGHGGGAHHKGGDLMYRWGNPIAYRRGTTHDQQLFKQHNAHWIPEGLQDAGKILVFNNGQGRPEGNFSTVDIIDPPITADEDYTAPATPAQAYAPLGFFWEYHAQSTSFFASNISGAQRLPGGNMLVCQGPNGRFFELDHNKDIVWEYVNPVNSGLITQGDPASQNSVFRCTQYPGSYPGFAGHALSPQQPLEINPIPNNCVMNTVNNVANVTPEQISVVNPFENNLIVNTPSGWKQTTITLLNMEGKICAQWTVDAAAQHTFRLDTPTSLSSGMYILNVQDKTHNTYLKMNKLP